MTRDDRAEAFKNPAPPRLSLLPEVKISKPGNEVLALTNEKLRKTRAIFILLKLTIQLAKLGLMGLCEYLHCYLYSSAFSDNDQ